ncbi:MAG: putative glycosyltransferase [Hyphomicrobiaceae bacterium]|jgi:predicted glycosyltransferase
MSKPRVLFYVQYLEGIGHVVRARRIANELVRSGCDVALVLGGNPIPGFELPGARIHQLPPLKASPDSYSKLLTEDGRPADEDYKRARRHQLLAIYETEQPDVLLTEAYPMGRWAMHFELEPLLARANDDTPRPMIVASLRDILQMPKTVEKAEKSIQLFEQFYDHMLVHGDPNLVRVEESFPPLAGCLEQAHYTGIVAPEEDVSFGRQDETFDVIVSGGGGAIGYDVLAAAIAAKPFSALSKGAWLALAGPRMTEADFTKLATLAGTHDVQLERYRDGLTDLMAHAQISIQRAGYNTIADMLIAGCRGVLVPDADGGQMEQPLRAAKVAELGRAVVVREDELSASTLAAGIDRAMAMPATKLELNFDGATRSAEIICDLYRSYQGA